MARALRRRLDIVSADLRASALLVSAFVVFSAMAVLMRMIGERVAVPQVILVRQVIALLLMAPLFWSDRQTILRPARLGLHLIRGALAAGAMLCGLTAILRIPLADATAIGMAEVPIATALAAFVLGEQVGWRRWAATAVGLAGVLIMVQPFGAGLDIYALVALGGAGCGAASLITLRLGSRHDTTATVLFWQGLVVAALAAPFAAATWLRPTLSEAVILLVMGLIFTLGVWLFTAAIRLGRASAIAPLGYLRLILMSATGWLLYDEIPGLATVVGGLLVIGSATYTITRNAARNVPVPPANPSPN